MRSRNPNMRSRIPILLAVGVSLGVVGAYLVAGGASYKPLAAADPCEPRSGELLADRGVLDGIVLSALDGAACELQVSREELTAALSGDEADLEAFAERYDVEEERIDQATRAALVRAVEDADREDRLPAGTAGIARFIAERAPVAAALDAFRAVPGDPTPAELLEAARDVGLRLDAFEQSLRDLLDGLGLP